MIRPVITPGRTCVVLIQNGLDIELPIIAAFPKNTVISAISMAGSRTEGENKVIHSATENILLGPHLHNGLDHATQMSQARAFVEMYSQGGCPKCNFADDIATARWHKLLWNSTFNTLCALMRMNVGEIHSSGGRESMLIPMMNELNSIAEEEGHILPEGAIQDFAYGLPNDCPYRPSMLLDIEHDRPMELEVILGNPLKRAKQRGIPAPKLSAVYELLKMAQWRLTKKSD
jgi:2-dehydropantoate 2-reductase